MILKKNNQKVFLLLYNNFKLIGLFKNISQAFDSNERLGYINREQNAININEHTAKFTIVVIRGLSSKFEIFATTLKFEKYKNTIPSNKKI